VAPSGNWTPPACWYAPKYTPAQFKKEREAVWAAGSTGSQWDLEQRQHYVEGKPYKNFNLGKTGKGYWWDSYVNEARLGDPSTMDCDKPTFWVDEGDPPPPNIPQAVTPEILARLAYAEIRVPGTDIELAPENNTTVNLPTWAWLDKATFKPVSVTASIPLLDIQATTTATPVSLRIEPGTKDAELHPPSGECTIKANGSIGTPYTNGTADKTPPCGLTYLHSSGNGTYKLQATITWKINWTGTGSAGGNLPDGTFGNSQNITVQEIQSINR
jgi:enoyl reductase